MLLGVSEQISGTDAIAQVHEPQKYSSIRDGSLGMGERLVRVRLSGGSTPPGAWWQYPILLYLLWGFLLVKG